eukprot:5501707-Heterocapsa_arctica.AAC.1
MEGSKLLAQDLAYYDRLEEDSPKRTYDFLLDSMERHVNIARQKANLDADTKAIRSGNVGLTKGAPAINSEGLSKNAIKKAAQEAKALAAPEMPLQVARVPAKARAKPRRPEVPPALAITSSPAFA